MENQNEKNQLPHVPARIRIAVENNDVNEILDMGVWIFANSPNQFKLFNIKNDLKKAYEGVFGNSRMIKQDENINVRKSIHEAFLKASKYDTIKSLFELFLGVLNGGVKRISDPNHLKSFQKRELEVSVANTYLETGFLSAMAEEFRSAFYGRKSVMREENVKIVYFKNNQFGKADAMVILDSTKDANLIESFLNHKAYEISTPDGVCRLMAKPKTAVERIKNNSLNKIDYSGLTK